MSMNKPSLSTIFFDPEAEPMPEPEPTPEPPKRRGRPPGAKNKPKPQRNIPWFTIWRAVFWAVVGLVSIVSLYRGVHGWLGQSAAYIVLAVSVVITALLLDRDWKKMRA